MRLAYIHTPESRSTQHGFTILELLVAIVIVAVIALISFIAYSSVQANAAKAVLQSDLVQASKDLDIAQVREGSYPSNDSSLSRSEGTNFVYTGSGDSYCLTAWSTAAKTNLYISNETGSVQEGTCSGHTGYVSGGGATEIVANSPIQNVTQAQCQALPTFTGSNETAVRTVTDNRGGTTRTYEIAKLADNKCWMLTNLKLGSTSSSITLTPADSNVASNFTLPQLNNGSRAIIWSGTGNDYDTPYAYGPVPGDTGSGTTNYGYLYNFPAATAGETRTTLTTGNAQYSICPANWRLPTGGSPSSDFGQLDVAFGGTGVYASDGPSIAKWQPSGPFKGSFSGFWGDDFGDQGDAGVLWAASADPDHPDYAFLALFVPSYVYPGGDSGDRIHGFGVRCLLR